VHDVSELVFHGTVNRYKNSISYKWISVFSCVLLLSVLDYCLPILGSMTNTKYERLDNIILKLAKIMLPKPCEI